ncbi:aminoglycoside phosphotransferase family protein [Streptomyces caniscabiei]|uniref:Aminoglycoside phosphotransferase family protein n=1 Tax=Streptomyces caniscabiei TaxID=2746961 RepID=A0ABU4MWG6_9ACTN|nr:aminoglycoside phosphotransferase family protein [Streptomyces caniscabiei]MBE4740650.1 aminoglycoside phosphotransferase family protein [Streptomyces caniscabiei]MBE4759452.1 aminoglycoside phosphotransferase family protein [Streptomyces caniscabiei]MBE4774544.1 aminoglycoside phosphotransferase family protein [Streptomyces caniscabiei]MBE4788782.1 aminoglycoside phosphotransferase family protein [Streptomyces caniscabiei]MBE4798095.1 aminoglycoside phosphotransferase family protein [Strep
MAMHDDQVDVTAETVATLIREQFPEWGDKAVRPLPSTGTVNAIFRVGDDLSARFPLRPADAGEALAVLEREAGASAELARMSPFPAPEPVALGKPGAGYPMPWSVQTWLPGTIASDADPSGSHAFAEDLATLVAALRQADTRGRPFDGEGRGGVLTHHDDWMAECFARSEGLLDVPRLRRMWSRLRELPRTGADVMSHRDLIPGNVLVAGDRLGGVLDTGGFGPADPALDLVAAWHILRPGPREVLRRTLGCDDLEWERGKAWAFEQAMGLVWYYVESNPTMSALGRRTLDRLLTARP